MLAIKYQTAFKKDYKRIVRRGYDVRLLEEVIAMLAGQTPLPENYTGITACRGIMSGAESAT